MSKLLAVAALSGAGLMAGIGTAEAAASEPVTGWTKGFATAYSSPSNQSKGMYTVEANTQVDTYCYREGQVLEGDPRWFIVNTNGASAYVHVPLISVDPNEVGHC
jgi:hypothetical protein